MPDRCCNVRGMLTVSYENVFALLDDLRAMGEANLLQKRQRRFTSHWFWHKVAERYQQLFSDDEGRIIASFELITLTGWHPHSSQQQPAARGSGKLSLAKLLRE